MKRANWIGLITSASLALVIFGAPAALASLSQGYATTTPIPNGSLVSLDPKSSGTVDVATLNNVGRLFGVVVPPSSASISLSGTGSGQVQVATSGTANILVSTAGGNIAIGDYLTISQIAGVAQKVNTSSTRVIGTASADFSSDSSGATSTTVSGKSVAIGQIPVVIDASTYTSTDGKQAYVIPDWLQNLSNTVAGKSVSPLRIIVGGLILLVALACVTVLLYSAVRNSIISIGRNPLSRGSVLGGLMQVLVIAIVILAVTAAAIYFVIAK